MHCTIVLAHCKAHCLGQLEEMFVFCLHLFERYLVMLEKDILSLVCKKVVRYGSEDDIQIFPLLG